MKSSHKNTLMAVLAIALIACLSVLLNRGPDSYARAEGGRAASGFPHYTVIDTEGHNLIVTDNQADTVYFYTVDKDKEVGSELKLRGSLDLTQVGKPTIKPKKPE